MSLPNPTTTITREEEDHDSQQMLFEEQEGNDEILQSHNSTTTPSSSSSLFSRLSSSLHLSHLFLPMSSLTTQQQQLRRRLILSITITLVIISVHLLIIIIFFSSYNKYTANGASGEEGPNIPLPTDPGGDEEEDDNTDKSRRTLFTYLITIPNLIFLFLMSCCVFSLCLRKLVVKYLQSSDSSFANHMRTRLLLFGIYIPDSRGSDAARGSSLFNSGEGLELGDSNRNGTDLYNLHLSMVDRDFDENDYEALLALDDNNVMRNRIKSEYDLKRTLISYTIPPNVNFLVGNKLEKDDCAIEMVDGNATMVELSGMDDDSINDSQGLLSSFDEQEERKGRDAGNKAEDDYCTLDEARRLLESQCVICLEDFIAGDSVSHLRTCPHEFHTGCISEALKVKATCPICKADAL